MLKDKIALVFGGAGGLGGAISERLVAQGATVIPTSRNQERVENIVRKLESKGNKFQDIWLTDTTITDNVKKIVSKVIGKFGMIDVMVYASGMKGWQIIVPTNKNIKKEYWVDEEGNKFNTHYALAFDIQSFLGIPEGLIDFTAYYEKRFYKMPYSLDGRNMRPIIPLSYSEFLQFKEISDNVKDDNKHPMLTIEYWLGQNLDRRGCKWNNDGDIIELNNFLDDVL